MLITLLQMLESGKYQSMVELAKALSVSLSMLMDMIRQLAGLGYLEEIRNCSSACDGCASSGSCLLGGAQRVWAVTPKGRTVALKNSAVL